MEDVFFSKDRIFKLGPMRGIYFTTFAAFFILTEAGREIYRPYAYQNDLNDFGFADVVGNLLGTKICVNEFVAYAELGKLIGAGGLSERSIIIATYALCGFANFSSVGIQLGGIGALSPGRRTELARLGLRAMFGGAFASWMTATVAGLLL